jgi:trehalose utilization protein
MRQERNFAVEGDHHPAALGIGDPLQVEFAELLANQFGDRRPADLHDPR